MKRVIVSSEDLGSGYGVGTYDGNNWSVNDFIDQELELKYNSVEGVSDDEAKKLSDNFDFQKYFEAVVSGVAAYFEKHYKGRVRCLVGTRISPKFYNYTTDSVNFEFTLDDKDVPNLYKDGVRLVDMDADDAEHVLNVIAENFPATQEDVAEFVRGNGYLDLESCQKTA